VHSEVYLNKYVVSIAPFSTPTCFDCSENIQKTAAFFTFSLFTFLIHFSRRGVSWPRLPLCANFGLVHLQRTRSLTNEEIRSWDIAAVLYAATSTKWHRFVAFRHAYTRQTAAASCLITRQQINTSQPAVQPVVQRLARRTVKCKRRHLWIKHAEFIQPAIQQC